MRKLQCAEGKNDLGIRQGSDQGLGLLAQIEERSLGTHGLSGKQETREVIITKPG